MRTSGWRRRAGAIALGLVLDQLLREPSDRFHPVAWFGRAMTRLEAVLYRDGRGWGMGEVALGTGLAAGAGMVARRALGPALATTAAVTATVGGHLLTEVAAEIGAALDDGDLVAARARLPALVGRDPTGLEQGEIARAVVESVAENTVDALAAPVCWALAGGAVGVAAYRAVNTLDAMIGHRGDRYERYGWAAARLDDLANSVPARLTALLVAAIRPRRAAAVWRAVRDDAPGHPSPNAGVAEAAFAAALDIRLGGTNRYVHGVEERPALGRGRPASPDDIARAIRLCRAVTGSMVVTLAVVAAAPAALHLVREQT